MHDGQKLSEESRALAASFEAALGQEGVAVAEVQKLCCELLDLVEVRYVTTVECHHRLDGLLDLLDQGYHVAVYLIQVWTKLPVPFFQHSFLRVSRLCLVCLEFRVSIQRQQLVQRRQVLLSSHQEATLEPLSHVNIELLALLVKRQLLSTKIIEKILVDLLLDGPLRLLACVDNFVNFGD